ncbi:MAG: M13 family metallopeptidase [Bacteroidales bacterium]|jgi:putative endopeptidase|nr:M13 family metallopeptidase [Bacteroidales bacterium]
MIKKQGILIGISLLIGMSACNQKEKNMLNSGINQSYLDTTVSPAHDFYQYACGGWMQQYPLTGEYARYGSFDKLGEENQEQLKELMIEIASKSHKDNSIAQKIGDLYNMGMDSVLLEKQGASTIEAGLQAIIAMKSIKDLSAQLVDLHLGGTDVFFTVFAEANPQNSNKNIAWLWQSGLGIGDRDYYLEEEMQKVREQYEVLLVKIMKLSAYNKMAKIEGKEEAVAKAVLKLETEMAKINMDKIDLRDPYKTYNYISVADLQKMMSAIDVPLYLKGLGISHIDSLNVGQPAYIEALNTLLTTSDFNTIKAYVALHYIINASSYLSDDFVAATFDFYGKVLSGKTEIKPRWKRVVATVDGSLGEAVGEMYVKKYFPPQAKERMLKLVDNLRVALAERIEQNTWMTADTKEKAKDKLNAMIVKIGYPDKWRDYSGLVIKKDSYYANVQRAVRFEAQYQLSKVGKDVDRTLWLMTPQTVNAYYNPTTNEICFPAGILQPPFFDMQADDAVNYGAIGVVIGHEMTHGFDDQGRNYDKNGNLNDWWTATDSKNFEERTKVLVDYFNKIEVLPGIFANGLFTLGENIADNGGVNVSYVALQKAKQQGTVEENMDGFTAEQRFFIAYAGVWAGNIRDEEIIRRTKEDPHSLGKWRVNGTLPHIPAFIKAFKVKEGDAMYLPSDKQANIW